MALPDGRADGAGPAVDRSRGERSRHCAPGYRFGPDGAGLPAGGATARQGKAIYGEQCAGCHGPDGQKGRNKLAGPPGDTHYKTIGNY